MDAVNGHANGHGQRPGEELLARLTYSALKAVPTDVLTRIREHVEGVIDVRERQYDLFQPAAAAADPVAPAEASGPVKHELAAVLSPSQVRTWLTCQTRWWYRYGLGLSEPKTAALAIGSAVHAAIGENFRQKIESKRDLPQTGVVAVFRDAWRAAAGETQFQTGEDPDELGAMGEALTVKYMDEAAPFVEPAAVELPVRGAIAGVAVQGVVDLLDVDGRIVDLKTSAKSPAGIDGHYRRQVATYTQLAPGATGAARIDTLTKTRTLKLVSQSFTVNGADLMDATVMYPLAQEGMRSGLYTPNRSSYLCSRKHCPHWRRCEAEYGGEVSE